MFRLINIIGHKISSLIGVLIGLSVGTALFLFVYYGKGTISDITPMATTVLPVVIGFLLYGEKEKPE
jgi:xanthine/uracil permease